MNVEWVEGDIAGGKGAFGIIESGLTMAIFRQRDGSVWFTAALPKSALVYDAYRMPILWVDETVVCDAGETAELTRHAEGQAANDPKNFFPYHMVDDTVVGFRLWHGVEKEGLGCIRTFLEGRELTMRYFVRPYDSIDVTVPLTGVAPLLRETLGLTSV